MSQNLNDGNIDSKDFLRKKALIALKKAKEIETKKIANGSHYVKTGNKTYCLKHDIW